jgi:DNA-binding IclR family transcriptional regulator
MEQVMNNTLQNGFKLLEYMADTAEAYSVKDLAEIFKMPNSHICRLLKTLTETGYIEQVKPSRKYKISLKILTLSHACLSRMELRNRLRPFLGRLASDLNVIAYLSVPLNWHPVIVDVFSPNGKGPLDSGITIGSVNPINCSASGKVCAAYYPDNIDEFLKDVDFKKLTDRTILTPDALKKELAVIRREKVSLTDAERSNEISAAASPVFQQDGTLAAIIGVSFCSTLSPESKSGIREKIHEAGDNASYSLGYTMYHNETI